MGFDGACHMFGPGGVDRQRAIPPPRNRTDLGDGALETVGSVEIQDGFVSAIYLMRNPDKLGGVAATWQLQRT